MSHFGSGRNESPTLSNLLCFQQSSYIRRNGLLSHIFEEANKSKSKFELEYKTQLFNPAIKTHPMVCMYLCTYFNYILCYICRRKHAQRLKVNSRVVTWQQSQHLWVLNQNQGTQLKGTLLMLLWYVEWYVHIYCTYI